MALINEIKEYILFLKKEMGLHVTLHPYGNENVIMPTELSVFNIHDNSYCIYAKSCDEFYSHCVESQKKVREKASCGSFEGVCHAGVKEFVYPLTDIGTNKCGFVSVSGFKCENYKSYLKKASQKYSLPYEQLRDAYSHLQDTPPDKEWLDSLINPLLRMLELAYINANAQAQKEPTFSERVASYLQRYHCRNITSEDICKRFACSRSYMSDCFNKEMGMSIREYITRLRMEDAKQLLLYSKISITEIALTVGYADSNYFNSLFKRRIGMTPGQYRKNATL